MNCLYRRLTKVGLKQAFVRKVLLPDWWDDEIATTQAGYMEGLIYLSRHAGLDIQSLADDFAPIELSLAEACKYKKSKNTDNGELNVAQALATRLVQLATMATTQTICPIPSLGSQIRDEILANGYRYVTLSNLVDYCWSVGIPVLYLGQLPKGIKRPDGLAARVGGRPAIVICKNTKYESWMLFVLAHELGHIALGHVADDGFLLDESIHQGDDPDNEETAANTFASDLIAGRNVRENGEQWPATVKLVEIAQQVGERLRINPGYLLLRFGYLHDNYQLANAAVKILEPEANAPGVINEKMFAELDWSELSHDSNQFLARVTTSMTGKPT